MNIFVFGTRGFPYIQGGVEKHCENLYPLLPPRYRIVVFRRKPYVKELDRHYENIRFIDLPSTKIKGLEALIHSFLSTFYLLFKKTDIVHIHNIGPAFFSPLLKLRRRKIILTYHSPNYEHKKWNFIGKTLLRISEKIALSTSDVIIFVSNKQINKYGKKIKEKSVFIPNGINLPQISSDTRFLDSWNLIPRKYILAVGRITQEKGFDYLIGAFQKAQLPADYKLVIAGGADAEQSYFNSLKKMPSRNVIFTDYVFGEALAQLYSHAALFVL
ncbi:MAG: glycosyltransferase family 4 protein, partial [Dysgonamonadaceae bacterium]|nr:glycosyltransferase family 4 protein [Dysgonamonadaceae bacterium]